MPKRRPIFEFKGLSGFRGSTKSDSGHSSSTDESPRRPARTLAPRYQTPPRDRRRNAKRRSRPLHHKSNKHHKHHYTRRSHYVASQRHRRSRYEDNLEDQYYDDALRRVTRFPDEDDLDRSDVLRNHRRGRHPGSPPPYDPHTRGSPSREYPSGTHLSPERGAHRRSPRPSGYLDDYDPSKRAVDPRLEHSFSPSGLPEQEDDYEGEDVPSHHSEHARRHSSHGRHRRRRRKSRSKRGRRKKHHDAESHQDSNDGDSQDDDNREEGSASEEPQYDEDGNFIEASARGKKKGKGKQEGGKKKKKKKKHIGKIIAIALTALIVGLIAKRKLSKRKRRKAKEEAEAAAAEAAAAAAHQQAAGPYGGAGGHLYSGANPLQLPLPKPSFSVKVPETEAFIVERGGRYNRRLTPGSNILIPFVDRVAFRFSLKEVNMPVPVQQCYTRENVSVMASALIFARIEDAVAVAYGVDDARRSLMLLAQTCMRKEIAKLGVEQMLRDRDGLGYRILGSINRASCPWGVRCTRFEIRDLNIPQEVRAALERQAQVERQARTDVLASQGTREAMKNRADAEMHAQMRMSQARQIDVVNQAIGEAHAISERGEAIAGAMRDVAEVIQEPGGEKAMQMRIAEQYLHSYANAAKNQEHLPPPPNPADMAAAMSNAMGLLTKLEEPGSTKPAPALEQHQGSNSQSGDDTRPPQAASDLSGPSPGASSKQLSQSEQGTPQIQLEMPPISSGTQSLPQNASSEAHHVVPSSYGGSNVSHANSQVQIPTRPHVQRPQGQYAGPVYPQA